MQTYSLLYENVNGEKGCLEFSSGNPEVARSLARHHAGTLRVNGVHSFRIKFPDGTEEDIILEGGQIFFQ